MRDTGLLAKECKTFEQFIKKLQSFPAWYEKTEEQLKWGKAQWYEFYTAKHEAK